MADEVETKVISTYSPKITLDKYIYELLEVLGISGFTWAIDYLLPNLQIDYPEYAAIIIILVPVITAIRNWLKHRHDTEEVPV